MKYTNGCIFLLVFLFLAAPVIHAQEIALDDITITSSLSEKRSSETGRNITIIRGEQFSRLPVHSLDDLLRYVPGVEIQTRGPMGSQSDIVLRGGTFQQVLVVLDGLRLNDPNTGHFNSYIPISPAEIDRIEVLKGASSAIYGADAVGGVIHVITKTFASRKQADQSVLSAQASAGEYGFTNINAGGYYQTDKLRVSGGLLSNNANGVMQRGTRGFFHNTSASLSASYNFTDNWSLSYRAAYNRNHFAAQNFYTTFLSDTAREKVASLWQQVRLVYQKNKSRFSLDAGYKTLDDEYAYNKVAITNNNTSRLFQALALYQYELQSQSILTGGFNYQQKIIRSNDRGNHALYLAAPFVSLVQKIGDHLMVQPSLRTEFIEGLDPEFLPQLTVSYKVNDWQWRASGGKTIRDADFTERFNNYNKPFVAGGSIGNPALEAERSWNYEAGADWFYKHKLKLSATVFQRFQKKLIDYVTTPYADMPRKENLSPTGTYALTRNIRDVRTSGLEIDAQYTQSFSATQKLLVQAGITWLDSHSSEAVSFYISSHARFLANYSLQYECGAFTLGINGLYKKRKSQAAPAIQAATSRDYYVMNARLSYGFWQNRLAVFVQADNIFDRSYSDLLGASMPGRWMMGGVKCSIRSGSSKSSR